MQQFSPEVAALPLFSRVAFTEQEKPATDGRQQGPQQESTRDLLLSVEPSERARLLVDYLRETASRILGLRQTALDPRKPLNAMGLDSLMAIELKNGIQTNLGIVLPVSVIVSGPSIAELVVQMLELLNEQAHDGAASDSFNISQHLTPNDSLGAEEAEQLLASLDDLSSEQIDRLLAEMLNDSR